MNYHIDLDKKKTVEIYGKRVPASVAKQLQQFIVDYERHIEKCVFCKDEKPCIVADTKLLLEQKFRKKHGIELFKEVETN